jgi:transposase
MPWTVITRPDSDRRFLRYSSDCSDKEWNLIAPFLVPASTVGRPRKHSMRLVWNAISYNAATGCQSLPSGQAKRRREGGYAAERLPTFHNRAILLLRNA